MFKKLFLYFLGSELQNRFMLFFIILASFPILILGSMSIYLIDLSHRHDVANLENQLLEQKSEEIRKFLGEVLGIIQLKLGVTQTGEVETGGKLWQEILIDGILASHSGFEEVAFADLQGRERARRSKIVTEPELTNIEHLPYFKEAVSGRVYISDVYYTTKGPVIIIASPVWLEKSVIQVLSARLNLSSIVRSIELGRLGTSGYIFLLDRNKVLVATPRLREGIHTGVSLLGVSRFNDLGQRNVSEEDRYTSIFSGVPVVGSLKFIPEYKWTLFAEWPTADADALIADVRSQVINLSLFSILAVLLLAPIFTRRLLQPIRALKDGTEEIEKGNFEKQVQIKTKDELEDLGAAFNKMASGLKRLQELKNEFVFIAAHELRSPVTAMRGYVSLIVEEMGGGMSDSVKHYLDVVTKSNERLVKLINDILEIARSEAGRLKIEVAEVKIGDEIRQIMAEAKGLADPKKISLSYESEKDHTVKADSGKVKEIVMNFVSNAIKYNREGGWVRVYHEVEGKNLVTHVEDNGLGMSEDDQKHMFEKFFRANSGAIKTIQGTGLGLFITKELIEKMGGKVWFLSREGRGTRFSFSLPCA